MAKTVERDSISAALDVIGDRWSLLILRAVFSGHHRFSDLRGDLGIASNLLSDRLATLVAQGVLVKVPYQERPVRHDYRLSDAGRDLSPVLISIMQWGDRHRAGDHSRTRLIHAGCNAPVENFTRCTACNKRLEAHEIKRDPELEEI